MKKAKKVKRALPFPAAVCYDKGTNSERGIL